ncbi:MAG: hypothetical protein JSV86_16855 [Gemmatimonadota bacterium]|nr:MAG: hypothetical protein JSV86_16855 [Gemmatimonadota bacterium]
MGVATATGDGPRVRTSAPKEEARAAIEKSMTYAMTLLDRIDQRTITRDEMETLLYVIPAMVRRKLWSAASDVPRSSDNGKDVRGDGGT